MYSMRANVFLGGGGCHLQDPVSLIHIWSENFSHLALSKSEAKNGGIEGVIRRQSQSRSRRLKQFVNLLPRSYQQIVSLTKVFNS